MFEIGETYRIGAKYKKNSLEKTTFTKNDVTIVIEEYYRWSYFDITPQSEEEVEMLLDAYENEYELFVSDFKDFEVWDKVDSVAYYWNSETIDTDVMLEEMEEGDMWHYEYLVETKDYEETDCEFIILGGITIE